MSIAQFNKLQYTIQADILLKDMCRNDHVTATFAQNTYFFEYVAFQFFIAAFGNSRINFQDKNRLIKMLMLKKY